MLVHFSVAEREKNSRDFFLFYLVQGRKRNTSKEYFYLQFFFCEYSVLFLLQLNRKHKKGIFLRKLWIFSTG